jgi:hypothetical protein
MGKRETAARQRAWLLAELGERCAKCSRQDDLQFDCIFPMGPTHHGLSSYDRVMFYVQQFHNKNLQLLCGSCNVRKSEEDKVKLREAAKCVEEISTDHRVRPVTRRGPEPSVSDWTAWCRWHRGEPPL